MRAIDFCRRLNDKTGHLLRFWVCTIVGTASEQAIKAAQDSKDQLMMIYEVVSTKTQDFLAEVRPRVF